MIDVIIQVLYVMFYQHMSNAYYLNVFLPLQKPKVLF